MIARLASPIRVVVCDPSPIFRYGLTALCEATPDLELVGATSSGDAALAVILAEHPDVVVIAGEQLHHTIIAGMRASQEQGTRTRFLVMLPQHTAASTPMIFTTAAQGYLLDDVEPHELLRAIRTVAQGQVALDGAVSARLLQRVTHHDDSELLSPREAEVLRLMIAGASNKTLAQRLSLSENTVRSHVSHILQKLGAESRGAAVAIALKQGLVPFSFDR